MLEKKIYNPFEDPYSEEENENIINFSLEEKLINQQESKNLMKEEYSQTSNSKQQVKDSNKTNLQKTIETINNNFEIEDNKKIIKYKNIKLVEFLETEKRLYIESLMKYPPEIYNDLDQPIRNIYTLNKIKETEFDSQKKINLPGAMGLFINNKIVGLYGISLTEKNNFILSRIFSRNKKEEIKKEDRPNLLGIIQKLIDISLESKCIVYFYINRIKKEEIYTAMHLNAICFSVKKIFNSENNNMLLFVNVDSLYKLLKIEKPSNSKKENTLFMDKYIQENNLSDYIIEFFS